MFTEHGQLVVCIDNLFIDNLPLNINNSMRCANVDMYQVM